MQDLYKGFKKVAEDDSSATLEHENGHKLNIAKSGLSKKHKKALEVLPLYQADGTQAVEDQTAQLQQEVKPLETELQTQSIGQQIAEDVKQELAQGAANATSVATGEPVQKLAGSIPESSEIISGGGSRIITPPTTPSPLDIGIESFRPGGGHLTYDQLQQKAQQRLDQQAQQRLEAEKTKEQYAPQVEQTLEAQTQPTESQVQQAATPSSLGVEPTPPTPPQIEQPGKVLMSEAVKTMTPVEVIASPYTNVMQKINAHNQMYMEAINRKAKADEEFQQKMRDKAIDPNRVYHNMSTGRKIRTIIGMLLGGMAGGVLRTDNPLQKMLNEEIERDVNLQKQDKTDAMNLYKMHYERLGDEALAHQAAANNLRSAALMEMEYAMGKLGPNSQMGRLAIQTAANQLKLQNEQAISGSAALEQKKQITNMIKSGNIKDVDPAELANILITDDGAKMKALEEIKDAQNLSANAAKILNAFQKAADDRGLYRSAKSLVTREMPESVAIFEQSLDPFFKDIAGQNREATKRATFDRLTPGKFDSAADVERKREALINFMRATKSAPVSKSYGLDLDKFSSTSWTDPSIEKENEFINYAKQNLNNPDPKVQKRVQFIKQKFGVK